jgi:formylmethanofuran dehydrogenase subunit D
MKNLTIKSFDIKPGSIMTYFPEANILIPQDVDSRSRTPSFKSIEVTVLQKDS